MLIGLSFGETGASLISVTDKVLEPPEQLGMTVQERGGELDQLGPADDLLIEEDQAAKEVVVHFRASQSLADFVEEGELVEAAELAGLGEGHVAEAVSLLLFRRRVSDSTRRSLDTGCGISCGGHGHGCGGSCGSDAAAALADALLAAGHAGAEFGRAELEAAEGGRVFLGQADVTSQA